MKEYLNDFIHWMPFVGLAVTRSNPGPPGNHQPIFTRLLEAGIIGAIVMYGTVQALGQRIEGLEAQVQDVRGEVRTIRQDLYRPKVQRRGG